MKHFFGLLSLAILLLLVAFVILMMKVGYPHYRVLSFIVYLLGWVPFILSLRRRKEALKKHGRKVKQKVRPYLAHIVVGLLLLVFAYVAQVLVPVEETQLTSMTDADLRQSLDQDLATLTYLRESLMLDLAGIREHPLVTDPPSILAPEEKAAIRAAWRNFLTSSFELDMLQLRYKGFYQIDYLSKPELHTAGYLVAFSAFCAQVHANLQATEILREKPHFEQVLNEPDPDGIYDHHDYFQIRQKLTDPKTLLRLNAGRSYQKLVDKQLGPLEIWVKTLREDLASIDQQLAQQSEIFIDNPLAQLEKTAVKGWFPIQKGVARQMSFIRVKDQDFFIHPEQVAEHQEVFEPGDILLERRNWYATNVGIPGFWPHSALYTGTPEEIDAYFVEVANKKPSQVLAETYPEAFKVLSTPDAASRAIRVIEAKRPGVILNSLEASANADSLAVLRPKVSKADKWTAIQRAFADYGKPYDYNFDFATDDALVCSELICKAYQGAEGLDFDAGMINGRVLFTPNHFAQKFAHEHGTENPQFTLELFLDGDEGANRSAPSDEATFVKSWKRPKWYIFTQ